MSRRHIAGFLVLGVVVVLPLKAADQPITHISGEQTRAAFAKGKPLVENDLYKIHASRRDAPGQAEVHLRDTDILIVASGTSHQFTEVSAPLLYYTVKVPSR